MAFTHEDVGGVFSEPRGQERDVPEGLGTVVVVVNDRRVVVIVVGAVKFGANLPAFKICKRLFDQRGIFGVNIKIHFPFCRATHFTPSE